MLEARLPDSDYVTPEHAFTAQEKATFVEEVTKEIESSPNEEGRHLDGNRVARFEENAFGPEFAAKAQTIHRGRGREVV